MNRPLGEATTSLVINILNRAYEMERMGDLSSAETLYQSAWEELPEPRTGWDFSLTVAKALAKFYYRQHQFVKAKQWLKIAFETYVPPIDTSTQILAGQIYFDSDDFSIAKSYFEAAYKRGKRRAFQGEDPKYLKFLLESP